MNGPPPGIPDDAPRGDAPQLVAGHPLFGLGYARPVKARRFTRVTMEQSEEDEAAVAEEVPVAFAYNGRAHAVMMATPADLEDFAIGFSLSEQIVRESSEILGVEVVRHAQGIELHLTIRDGAVERLATRPRSLIGRTSCGLCGVELISDALRDVQPLTRRHVFPVDALMRAESALWSHQAWNRETGSMHASAWSTADGEITIAREDVGRHNALDKVIGALARAGQDPGDGFIVMTSRASYELVQKVAIAGATMMAAVSRPTGLAIRLAEATGVALVGLLRDGTGNIYADPNQVLDVTRRTEAPRSG